MENKMLKKQNGDILRVVYLSHTSSVVYLVYMENRRWPFPMDLNEMNSLIEKGELEILEIDPYSRFVSEESLSEADIKRREKAWEIVSYIRKQTEDEHLLFITKYRQEMIKDTMKFYTVSYNTVKNYLLEYWKSGKIRNGLLPNFYLCGAKGKEMKAGNVKRGRPRKLEGNTGINIDENIKRIFRIALNRFYYNEKQNTLKFAYEMTIKHFFTEEVIKDNGVRVPVIKNPPKIPTYHQFLYWFRQQNVSKHEISKRKGTRVYHQKYRAIIGDSTQDAGIGPGSMWQIDSTPLDVYCVSKANRNIIVGKPLLHLVVDVYSRLIVGFSLSFESLNAYSGAMMALLNGMTSKKDFYKKYGVDINEESDVFCIPNKVFTDRGELNGKQIEGVIEGLGIDIQNSSSYRPEMKGIVEQALHRIQLMIVPHIPGSLVHGKRIRERGQSDFRLDAKLTLDEVTRILIECILFHNHHHVNEDYVLSEDMLANDVEKIPKRIWDYGIEHQKGRQRTLPDEVIKLHLLPVDTATITARGLRYKKLYYASEYSLKHNWFEKARIDGVSKVTIRYDPRSLSEIYIPHENSNEVHILTILDYLVKYKDKGIDEVVKIIEFEEKVDKESKERELQEKMTLFNTIEKVVQSGEQQASKERNVNESKSSRLKGIKENQKNERELERSLLGENENKKIDSITIDEASKNIEIEDDLDLFRQLRE